MLSRLQLLSITPLVVLLMAAAPQEPEPSITAEEIIANGKAKTTAIMPRCRPSDNSEEILVCADPDADTRYRRAEEFRERRTTIKGGVPDAPNTFGIPNHGPVVARGCFIGPCPKEPIVPYTADQLPEVDQEYLELARQAEAEERRRQAAQAAPD